MAINAVREWHPHLGSIWARMVALWAASVRDESLSFAITTTTASSFKCVRFDVVGAVDTTRYDLVDGSQFNADNQWIGKMSGLPGWFAEPPIQPLLAGARNVQTDWTTNMHAARRAIWSAWCAAPTFTSDVTVTFATAGLAYSQKITHFTVRRGMTWAIDWTAVPTLDDSATDYAYLQQPICIGVPTPALAVSVAGGGGGGITEADGDRIADALEAMEASRLEVSMNHGAVNVTASTGTVLDP